MKILVENTKTVSNKYTEEDIEKLIDTLQVALGVFGDDGLRCMYLLKAEKMLQKVIANVAESCV